MHWNRIRNVLPAIALMLALPGAYAQDGPPAFAAVQAPEAGVGICFSSTAGEALQCAQNQCMEESGYGLDVCYAATLCLPGLWTVDIFMQHREGPHWHTYSCGWQTREQAEAAAAIACQSEWLIECAVVQMWDPQGNEQPLD